MGKTILFTLLGFGLLFTGALTTVYFSADTQRFLLRRVFVEQEAMMLDVAYVKIGFRRCEFHQLEGEILGNRIYVDRADFEYSLWSLLMADHVQLENGLISGITINRGSAIADAGHSEMALSMQKKNAEPVALPGSDVAIGEFKGILTTIQDFGYTFDLRNIEIDGQVFSEEEPSVRFNMTLAGIKPGAIGECKTHLFFENTQPGSGVSGVQLKCEAQLKQLKEGGFSRIVINSTAEGDFGELDAGLSKLTLSIDLRQSETGEYYHGVLFNPQNENQLAAVDFSYRRGDSLLQGNLDFALDEADIAPFLESFDAPYISLNGSSALILDLSQRVLSLKRAVAGSGQSTR